jgi:hypothetical protein
MKYAVQHFDLESCSWDIVSEHDTFEAAVLRAQLDRSDGIDARIRSPEQRAREAAARNVVCGRCGERGHVSCNR